MRALRDGEPRVSIPVNPDPLYTVLGYATQEWDAILERFQFDRSEWRRILESTDGLREIRTTRRIWSTQTLTKRLVDHETRHLDTLLPEGN